MGCLINNNLSGPKMKYEVSALDFNTKGGNMIFKTVLAILPTPQGYRVKALNMPLDYIFNGPIDRV